MTRAQWKSVVDFSLAVGADIVTSVSISDGTRDAQGNWTSGQAKEFLDYTKQVGGTITATEFMNEPTFAAQDAATAGYDTATFAKLSKLSQPSFMSNHQEPCFLAPEVSVRACLADDDRTCSVNSSMFGYMEMANSEAQQPDRLPEAHGTVLGWQVWEIEASVRELSDRGIVFERFDGLIQNESGIWSSPTGARVAWFRDPDGNILSISEHVEFESSRDPIPSPHLVVGRCDSAVTPRGKHTWSRF